MQPPDNHLISTLDPKSPVVEAFRTLRTNLQYTNAGEQVHKLIITSSGPGEGKSTISANLSHVLAESGKKVIVVGCDLRKPSIHKYFQIPNHLGVTNILVGQATVDQCLKKVPVTDNLEFLPSGPIPPNPSELLGSRRMDQLIDELAGRADIVIFDAPPVIAVTDAAILAPKMDGVLLVVSMGTAPKDMVIRSKEQLVKVGGNILGIVINRVEIQQSYGYYYYAKDDEVAAAHERH